MIHYDLVLNGTALIYIRVQPLHDFGQNDGSNSVNGLIRQNWTVLKTERFRVNMGKLNGVINST